MKFIINIIKEIKNIWVISKREQPFEFEQKEFFLIALSSTIGIFATKAIGQQITLSTLFDVWNLILPYIFLFIFLIISSVFLIWVTNYISVIITFLIKIISGLHKKLFC